MFLADLHVHSKYSIATSKDCDLIHMAQWAALKGIKVLVTGDFTHPRWAEEIHECLTEAENGLYKIKSEAIPNFQTLPNGFGPSDVRFILNVEISSIYKRDGVTRKVHNLVFMPDLESMARFNAVLDRLGNIKSDGRPILGLDSRTLLQIALETSEDSFVVPAHIWTPWFSVLGSKSGFDTIEDCFGDLSPHIFALETGLSSDPEMNRAVGMLDRYTLISNSDIHSPARLGRECNIFTGPPGYREIRDALKAGGGTMYDPGSAETGWACPDDDPNTRFRGTVEFYPEEGKYHLDGHRKCGVRLEPEETSRANNRCPVCGQKLTVGVLNRVHELADRDQPVYAEKSAPFWKMISLHGLIAQALGVGANSKKVSALYDEVLRKLGPEIAIMMSMPLDEWSRKVPELFVEGLRRIRSGTAVIKPGFDGEYGKIELFGPGEREKLLGQSSMAGISASSPKRTSRKIAQKTEPVSNCNGDHDENDQHTGDELNSDQMKAIGELKRAVLVKAGPGTGKTRTLTARIVKIVSEGHALPSQITAVTFTNRAANEMSSRIAGMLPGNPDKCNIVTFHQLGIKILEFFGKEGLYEKHNGMIGEDESYLLFKECLRQTDLDHTSPTPLGLFLEIQKLKQNLVSETDDDLSASVAKAFRLYQEALRASGLVDLNDLITKPIILMEQHSDITKQFISKNCMHLLIDEFQDVNPAQVKMIQLLSRENGEGLFAIGDPDQAIYGFRGSHVKFFSEFVSLFADTRLITLTKNYRSQANVVKATGALITQKAENRQIAVKPAGSKVHIMRHLNSNSECNFIRKSIEILMGGTSFHSFDSGLVQSEERNYGFRDFAILYRLNVIGDAIEENLKNSGLPIQRIRKSNPKDEADGLDLNADAISLMTIHASKGLEFPVVFVVGCEEGTIPYLKRGNPTVVDLEEERRILYVAATRAKDHLYIMHSETRPMFGSVSDLRQSRFLADLGRLCCVDSPIIGKKRRAQQISLF